MNSKSKFEKVIYRIFLYNIRFKPSDVIGRYRNLDLTLLLFSLFFILISSITNVQEQWQ